MKTLGILLTGWLSVALFLLGSGYLVAHAWARFTGLVLGWQLEVTGVLSQGPPPMLALSLLLAWTGAAYWFLRAIAARGSARAERFTLWTSATVLLVIVGVAWATTQPPREPWPLDSRPLLPVAFHAGALSPTALAMAAVLLVNAWARPGASVAKPAPGPPGRPHRGRPARTRTFRQETR